VRPEQYAASIDTHVAREIRIDRPAGLAAGLGLGLERSSRHPLVFTEDGTLCRAR
jgi:hypothetical protein